MPGVGQLRRRSLADSARRGPCAAGRAPAPARSEIRAARRCARRRPSCRSRPGRLRCDSPAQRMEDARIGRLVPGPGALRSSPLADRCRGSRCRTPARRRSGAGRKRAMLAGRSRSGDACRGTAAGSCRIARAVLADAPHQRVRRSTHAPAPDRRRPARDRRSSVPSSYSAAAQPRIGALETREAALAVFGEQVLQAPAVARLAECRPRGRARAVRWRRRAGNARCRGSSRR